MTSQSALPSFVTLLINPLTSGFVKHSRIGERYITDFDLVIVLTYLVQGVSLLVRSRPEHTIDLMQLILGSPSLGKECTFADVARQTTPKAINLYRDSWNDDPVSLMDLISFMRIGYLDDPSEVQLEHSRMKNVRISIEEVRNILPTYKFLGIGLDFPHLATPSINIDSDAEIKMIPDNQMNGEIMHARRLAEISTLGHASVCAALASPLNAINLDLAGFIQRWNPSQYKRVKGLLENKTDDGRPIYSR